VCSSYRRQQKEQFQQCVAHIAYIQNTQLSRQACWVLQLANGVALTLQLMYIYVSVGDLLRTAQISVRYEFGVYVGCGIVQLKGTLCALWVVKQLFRRNLYEIGRECTV
jgi:hypothetical protein